jgi:hypothetical protein
MTIALASLSRRVQGCGFEYGLRSHPNCVEPTGFNEFGCDLGVEIAASRKSNNPLDHESTDLYIILMPKSGHLKAAKAMLLVALVLATPALTFARGESGRIRKSNPAEWQKSTNKNRDMGATSGGRVHVETGPSSSGLGQTRAHDSSAFRK